MKLPKCWSCHYAFKWRELIFAINGLKKCPNCAERQYIKAKSSKKSGVIGLPILFIPTILNLFNLNWSIIAFVTFLFLIFFLALIPFQLEFTNDIEPLF